MNNFLKINNPYGIRRADSRIRFLEENDIRYLFEYSDDDITYRVSITRDGFNSVFNMSIHRSTGKNFVSALPATTGSPIHISVLKSKEILAKEISNIKTWING